MTSQTFKASRNNSSLAKNKRVHSEVDRKGSYNIEYHNHESEDYTEPEDRKAGGFIVPNKRLSVHRKVYREDKKYSSIQRNQTQGSQNIKNVRKYKDIVGQTPLQPQKPKTTHHLVSREQQQITTEDHLRSRQETDLTSNSMDDRDILIGFDINLYTEAHTILQQIHQKLGQGNLSNDVRKYLEIIATGGLDDYSNINLNLHKRKIVKLSILYQRISVLLVAFSEVTGNLLVHQNHLSNLLKYVLDNRVLILTLLQNRLEKLEINKTIITPESVKNSREARNFMILRDNNQIILQLIHQLSTEDNYFYQNLRKFIKGSSTFTIQQCFYFILEYFAFFLHLSGLQDKIPFLAVAPNPYLPPTDKYTLVFDFVEVMFNQKLNCLRPCSQLFIQEMSQFYELVTYCSVFPKEIQTLIKFADRRNKISHKLYKHHLVKYKSKYHKDLSRLGRPLSRVVLIDSEDCDLSPKNCLKIKKWSGSNKDTSLTDISQFLATIVVKKMNAEEAISQHNQQKVLRKMGSGKKAVYTDNFG